MKAEGPASNVLLVEARFVPSASEALGIDPAAAPFVRDAQYHGESGWMPLPPTGEAWRAPCHAMRDGCWIRYSFALREAATQLDEVETAIASEGVLVAPPSTWLLHPPSAAAGDRFRLRLTTEGGALFATALAPAPASGVASGGDASSRTRGAAGSRGQAVDAHETAASGSARTFEAATKVIDQSSFAVFGSFDLAIIRTGEARVQVATPRSTEEAAGVRASGPPTGKATPSQGDGPTLSRQDVVAWVDRAVSGLSDYYGTFPVSDVLVTVLRGQDGETRGETISGGGPAIVVRAAKGLTAQGTLDDWVVTHELIHATLPSFGHIHAWLDEGIATYVEPIVRVRAKLVAVETFWRELVDGLPQGLPEANDQGLERTRTWGRTYWGGALFCLVADVRIRQATAGARSFDDVLRALITIPLDDSRTLDVSRLLEVGDRATGTSALSGLYREMALAPGTIDLASLWASLGVHRRADGVGFDDAAPLAFVRQGITRPEHVGTD